MIFSDLIKEKRKVSESIKSIYSLPKKHKATWLIKIENTLLLKELEEWLAHLPANFVIESENFETNWYSNITVSWNTQKIHHWFDFIICDSNIEWLNEYFSKWIVPITSEVNQLWSILKEFNPIKNEWNSYLYNDENKWSIFYSVVRYLENYKFPFDNKNLVKNIFEV